MSRPSRAAASAAFLALAAACAHAPAAPLSDPPRPVALLVLRAPERISSVLGSTRIAVQLRNEGNRWAMVELDPQLLTVEGRDAAGKPLLCRSPRRARRRPATELGASAGRTLVVHLEDRCAVAEPGSYTLLLTYQAPEAGGDGPYTAGPVEVKLEVAPASAPVLPGPAAERSACVDRELTRRGLNAFGDPPGTVYAGGTPLFDEKTGRTEDRFDHVIARRPDIGPACDPAREKR